MDQTKLHQIISELATLRGSKETKARYLQRLKENVQNAVQMLSPCVELEKALDKTDKVTMQFISTSLYVLKQLASISKDDTLNNLISIQQQQKIKILLQMIFSIGVMPSHYKGVNILLANKTAQLNLSDLDDLDVVELYCMVSEVLRSLFEILKAPNLRSLILIHLGDIMAALLQLVHIGEFKKPVKSDTETERKPGKFIMTEEWYDRLVKDRAYFTQAYNELVDDIYKPLVIRELLILLAPPASLKLDQEAASPLWLRRVVSQQLSGYLTSPGGVSLIMRAMCESSTENVDWKKVDAIAKLISTFHGNLSPDEFYSRFSPQIIALLNTTGSYCIPVAKKCIKNIYQYNADICNKYIFDKLFEPFVICSQAVTENFNGILISEDSLSRCIDHLNKCFTPGSKESSLSFKALMKIVKIKYKLYMKVAGSPYQHLHTVQDLLIRFLHSYNDLDKLTAIYNALMFNEPHEDMLEMNSELEFEFGPSGGIQVVKRSKSDSPSVSDMHIELESEVAGDYMLDLLSHNEDYSKKLLYNLFVVLLSSMPKWYYEKIEIPDTKQDLLNAEELIVFIVGKSEKKMISIKLLAVLAENVQVIEGIQENPQVICKFVENLLEKKAESILQDNMEGDNEKEEEEDDDDDDGFENMDEKDGSLEDLIVTLAVLDILTMNMKVGSDRWNYCKPLLNYVKIIKDNCKDTFVKFLANLLYERIITQGAVSGSRRFPNRALRSDRLANMNASESRMKVGEKSKVKLTRKSKGVLVQLIKEGKDKSEIDAAIEEACSEDVPTRGHGLIQIGKLVKKMDSETLSKKETVFTVLKQNLQHEDSYVYLSAINGLEALSIVETGLVLEILAEEYVDRQKDFYLQLKVGEVLVRVTRALGDVLPKYKSLLINTFLVKTKDPDEYMRASSLSNLGEVLKILGFGVGEIIQEVYICVQSIAATDKSDMARRSAVMVATLLLRGVTESTFMVLESVIRDLYRTLVHIYKTDRDEATRLHADLALAEIDRLVRSSFNKSLKLEKHIGILSLTR